MSVSYPVAKRYAAQARARRLRVLVVAPHPDDDAIGCGGTLLRLAQHGARIGVTYVTDGSASHVKSVKFPPDVLRDVRESEAQAALDTLGIRAKPQFLRAPDGGLSQLSADRRARLIRALAERIRRRRADIVFAPWPRDPHPDHVAAAKLVADALPGCGRRPALYWYGVWLPVRGSAAESPASDEVSVIDVRLEARDVERKRRAILAHRSQTGALIDDDPDGFRIDAELLMLWLKPTERFYRPKPPRDG